MTDRRAIDSEALAKHGIVSISDNLPQDSIIDPRRLARMFMQIFGKEIEAQLSKRAGDLAGGPSRPAAGESPAARSTDHPSLITHLPKEISGFAHNASPEAKA